MYTEFKSPYQAAASFVVNGTNGIYVVSLIIMIILGRFVQRRFVKNLLKGTVQIYNLFL